MKLNIVLPWICVLGISAGLAAVYVQGTKKDAELTKLRGQVQDLQQVSTELAEARDQSKLQAEEVAGLRKDKEELLRLRSEIGKLRDERQQLSKQVQSAQSEAQRAQAEGAQLRAGLQQAQQQRDNQPARPAADPAEAQANACINNLRQLEAAKQQWALAHGKTADAIPLPQDLQPYLNNVLPRCPAGGSYTLNGLNQPPTCSVPGHVLPK